MEAAHVTWRPLGELFVERGLISREELEDALVEQHRTHKRLGAILVSRGLVSGPELTSVLVDQLGMELTKESGFGSGLWDEIRRRHPRTHHRPSAAVEAGEVPVSGEATPEYPTEPPTVAPVEDDRFDEEEIVAEVLRGQAERVADAEPLQTDSAEAELADADSLDLDSVEAELAGAREMWETAFSESRAELEAALAEERAAIQATLAEEQAGHQRALGELAQVQELAAARAAQIATLAQQVEQLQAEAVRADPALDIARSEAAELATRLAGLQTSLANERREREAATEELERSFTYSSSRTVELDTLAQQIDNLRGQVELSAGAVVAEQQVRSEMHLLEARVTALESALTQERSAHRDALEELDYARTEARAQATELRTSLDRIRAELVRMDAATTWFEYWSGAATPTIST